MIRTCKTCFLAASLILFPLLLPRRSLRSVSANVQCQCPTLLLNGEKNMKSTSMKSRVGPRNFLREGFKMAEKFSFKSSPGIGFLVCSKTAVQQIQQGYSRPLSTYENICRATSEKPTEVGKKVPHMQEQPNKDSFFTSSNGKSGTHLPSTVFLVPNMTGKSLMP